MLRIGLFGAALGIALSAAGTAQAQASPECRGMRQVKACNCAVNFGGRVEADPHVPGRKRWRAPSKRSQAFTAYLNCAGAVGL